MLRTRALTARLVGVGMWPCTGFNSSCVGYEQETETDKTVLQILYTDFPPIHATFFLKKVQRVRPKCTIHF